MAKINLLRIGKTLRERRGDRGIREVAAEIGVSPATLSRVERGKLPDLDTFSKVCTWLNVDPADVLQIRKHNPEEKETEPAGRETVVATHFRADSTLDPQAAQDLAQLLLAAHRSVSRLPR